MKLIATLMTILWAGMAFMSLSFQHYHHREERPIILFVGLWVVLFVMLACVGLCKKKMGWKSIFVMGVIFRVLLIPSNPIQEDDFYRYLWDGASLVEGVNPYHFSPGEIKEVTGDPKRLAEAKANLHESFLQGTLPLKKSPDELTEEMKELAQLGNGLRISELHYDQRWTGGQNIAVLKRVNHPDVPTVYPPLAQGFFALSAWVKPGSLWALRVVFVLVDIVTMVFVVKTLQALGRDTSHVVYYAWNPLVIKEFVNSPHLDVIMVSAASVFIWALVTHRHRLIGLALGLGVAAKYLMAVWALPLLIWWRDKALGPAVMSAGLVLMSFGIFSSAGSRQFQSLQLMSLIHWTQNSPAAVVTNRMLTGLENLGVESLSSDQKVEAYSSFHIFEPDQAYNQISVRHRWVRVCLLVLAGIWILWCFRGCLAAVGPEERLHWLCRLLLGVLLFSPILNPWYAGILMLFLPFVRFKATLLVFGAVLGFYYLRFYLRYHFPDIQHSVFSTIVLLEGLLVLLALWAERKLIFENKGVDDGRD